MLICRTGKQKFIIPDKPKIFKRQRNFFAANPQHTSDRNYPISVAAIWINNNVLKRSDSLASIIYNFCPDKISDSKRPTFVLHLLNTLPYIFVFLVCL